jgi:hypothetical protein
MNEEWSGGVVEVFRKRQSSPAVLHMPQPNAPKSLPNSSPLLSCGCGFRGQNFERLYSSRTCVLDAGTSGSLKRRARGLSSSEEAQREGTPLLSTHETLVGKVSFCRFTRPGLKKKSAGQTQGCMLPFSMASSVRLLLFLAYEDRNKEGGCTGISTMACTLLCYGSIDGFIWCIHELRMR